MKTADGRKNQENAINAQSKDPITSHLIKQNDLPLPFNVQGEIPTGGAAASFMNLIFQPPKVGPVALGDDDLIAVYEPQTQSVVTVTRKEYNQMK